MQAQDLEVLSTCSTPTSVDNTYVLKQTCADSEQFSKTAKMSTEVIKELGTERENSVDLVRRASSKLHHPKYTKIYQENA
jgi:hypothetical protein